MRYYLDTQTLAQVVLTSGWMSDDVRALTADWSNLFLSSSVCVKELIHLIQTGRIRPARKKADYAPADIISSIHRASITIVPANERHLHRLAGLPLFDNHNDPNDRLIIAQAIADNIPLISTDLKFAQYTPFGLELVPNR